MADRTTVQLTIWLSLKAGSAWNAPGQWVQGAAAGEVRFVSITGREYVVSMIGP
jgi:hypothetical protein